MAADRPDQKPDRLKDLTSYDQPFVTPESLADYFGVSRRHIRKEIEAGKLPAVRFGPRSIRVPIEEAINFERRCSSETSGSERGSSRVAEQGRSPDRESPSRPHPPVGTRER